MKTDFLGKELNIGDKVVFMKLKYRELVIGEITTMADKSCVVSHEKNNSCRTTSRQFYNQLIKIESEEK